MVPGSITAADAVYMLAVTGLFPVPQRLQQFGVDEIFATDPIDNAEIAMGVDGFLSAGFVNVPIKQSITLAANSPSVQLFDDWNGFQWAYKTNYRAQAVIVLNALGKKWVMKNGILSTYPPLPDAGRTLKARRFSITWESSSPAPV